MTSTVRRLIATLFAAQSLSSVGTTAAITVGTLAAAQLSGQAVLAGLAGALYTLSSALGAYPAGRVMDTWGRRRGLVLSNLISVVGATIAAVAILVQSFPILLLGYSLLGLGAGGIQQGRYAAADMTTPERRAGAISWVVLGSTVGGIAGPLMVGVSGGLVAQRGLNELAGPYMASMVALCASAILLFMLLRPDPREIARGIVDRVTTVDAGTARTLRQVYQEPRARLALISMAVSYLVMVMVMVMTPLHMTMHGLTLGDVSLVLASHITGMFGLSLLTGRLADRFGRLAVIVAGAGILAVSCVLAPLVLDTPALALALFLLGLGWNFCYVSGSSLLSDELRTAERGTVQGANDLFIGLTAGAGSLSSGILFQAFSYAGMSTIGLVLSLALLAATMLMVPAIARVQRSQQAV